MEAPKTEIFVGKFRASVRGPSKGTKNHEGILNYLIEGGVQILPGADMGQGCKVIYLVKVC